MDETTLDRRTLFLGAGLVGAGASLFGSSALAAPPPLAIPPGMSATPVEWSQAEQVMLWNGAPPGGTFRAVPRDAKMADTFVSNVAAPYLRVFRPARSNGRPLLVIPGGAYRFVSIRNEGVDVAKAFTALGYTVYVLVYRLPSEGWGVAGGLARADVPLADAQRAVRKVRSLAAAHATDPAKLSVIGFSAGGHLAASLLTDYAAPLVPPRDGIDQMDSRPAAGALIYPVIAMESPYTHAMSADLLLGPNPTAALVARRSPARHVTANTPPVFLAHAFDDPAVPWQNTRLFADAMLAAHRPVEVHYPEEGGHGFGTGPSNAPAGQWLALLASWLDRKLA